VSCVVRAVYTVGAAAVTARRLTVHASTPGGVARIVRSMFGPIELHDRRWRAELAARIVHAVYHGGGQVLGAGVLHALIDGDYDLARALARRS
jgi:hypothetical protein